MFKINNKVNKNKINQSLVESIKKNRSCIEYLEEVGKRVKDIYQYTGKRSDEIELEKIQWILFNMKYNTEMFEKTLKQNGGLPNAIQPFEWV